MKKLKAWDVEIIFKDSTVKNYKTTDVLNSNYRDLLTYQLQSISERWGLKNVVSIKFTR